jgi:Fuc2NAc and GlcNAc transferase
MLDMPYYVTLLLGAFAAAALLTWRIRCYALRRKLLDLPNNRSSHSQPTPRGGGIAIVAVTLTSMALLWLGGIGRGLVTAAYALGGLTVAAVGYLDDRHSVPPVWRLIVHLLAAALILVAVGKVPPVPVLGLEVDLGLFTSVLIALFIVWLLNLYNFMDGIDGIAAVEAVTVAGGAAGLLWYRHVTGLSLLSASLAASALGFLVWNWPPAKIFMGDVGSGFLGFSFGGLAVITLANSSLPIWVWLILLGIFFVDATITLIRRLVRREVFYEAHRSHAYQYASRKLGSHLLVSLAVATINLFWLLPLAFLVTAGRLDGVLGLLIAYVPLLYLTLHFKAGAKELQDA